MGGYVTGWKLPRDGERQRLLERFPPKYDRAIADHVTLQAGASETTPLPREVSAEIVAHADDGDSLECLVVSIDGMTDRQLIEAMAEVMGPQWFEENTGGKFEYGYFQFDCVCGDVCHQTRKTGS